MKKYIGFAVLALLMVNTQGFTQQISTTPDSLWVTLGAGDSLQRTLNIKNTGSSALTWDLRFNYAPAQQTRATPVKTKSSRIVTEAVGAPRKSSSKESSSAIKIFPTAARAVSQLQSQNSNILVIQDAAAWGVDMATFIFDRTGITATVINSSQIAETSFFGYDLIITVGDGSSAYYNEISANVSKFESFVASGGVVQYQLATQGDNVSIVGGVEVTYDDQEDFNTIELPSHPIVQGLSGLLEGNWANHCYLSNLPVDAKIITKTELGRNPTTAEYRFGAGYVIATGMTWEYLYINDYNSGPMMGLALDYSLTLEGAFLRANVSQGTIAPGDSQTVSIMVDAGGLYPGDYDATLELRSNDIDPTDSVLFLPIHVTVLPPVMGVLPDSLALALPSGEAGSISFTLSNTGLGRLLWGSGVVSSAGLSISFSPDKGNLVQGGSQQVTVNIAPAGRIGPLRIVVKVAGNDPQKPSFSIPINLTFLPPDIEVNNSPIVKNVGKGNTGQTNIVIGNTGQGKLRWSMSFTEPQPQTIAFQKTQLRKGNGSTAAPKNLRQMAASVETVSIPLMIGAFDTLMDSPTYLTCVTADPITGLIYAQENDGYAFYEYNPATDQWTELPECPIYSGNNGGAAYLNGKIYTIYTDGGGGGGEIAAEKGGLEKAANFNYTMGVYNIADSTWNTTGTPVASGLIESYGGKLYMSDYYVFVSFDPLTQVWDTLPHPGELNANFYDENTWGGLRYFNGFMYDMAGNGDTTFAKFNLQTEEWTLLPGVPGGAVLGSAIDPAAHTFYATGDYGDTNMYAFDLVTETWSVGRIPFDYIDDMGMAYVPNGIYRGIYLVQGEDGMGFARLNTSALLPWLTTANQVGSVSGNSQATVTLILNPDTLALGDYQAIISIFSNDPDESLIQIPLTMHVVADTTPPLLGIHFFQDKYLSQYVDVISSSNEVLGAVPLMSVVLPGDSVPSALPATAVDVAKGVYYSHYKLTITGNYTFRVVTGDSASNIADSTRILSVATLTKSVPALLASHDGIAQMTVEPKTSGVFVTVTREPNTWSDKTKHGLSEAYAFGPAGFDFGNPAVISFDYSAFNVPDDRHLVVYRITESGRELIRTTIDRTSKTASISAGQLGKYQLGYDESVSSQIAGELPKVFALKQNFPNPFNPSTTISYDLPSETKVLLTIYNVLGQEVRTLVDQVQAAGAKEIRWDGRDRMGRQVSSGVYLYRLKAGDFVSTRKMMFIK